VVVSTDPDIISVSTSPDEISTSTDASTVLVTTDPAGATHTTTIPGGTHTTTTPGATHTTTTPGQTHTTTLPGFPSGGAMFANSTACDSFSYQGAGGGRVGAVEANGGGAISAGVGSSKTIDYLALGRDVSPCTSPPYPNVTINHPPVLGPFSPQGWPVPIPTVPTPPLGCTSVP